MKKALVGFSILGGVAIFGYALYNYAKKQIDLLQDYEYKIVDFKITTFDLKKIKGSISVFFGSKSDVEVVIKRFLLDIYFNGEKVGYIEDTTPFVIPARGFTTIKLNYTMNPQIVIRNAVDLISYALKQKDASISIRGNVMLKSGFLSATLPIKYDTTIKEILAD